MRRVVADPELARAKVAQHGRHTAHVIAVRMGERNHVETMNMAAPEIGRDDILADVEITRVCRSADRAAGIDQHGAAVG